MEDPSPGVDCQVIYASMRVLHIVTSLAGSSGGPAQAVLQLCRELRNHGVEATIATTRLDADMNLPDTVPIRCFSRRFPSLLPPEFGFSPGFKNWLRENIKGFDLLHIHYLFTYPSTIACIYADRYKIPYILRPAGMLSGFCLKKSALKKRFYALFFEKSNLQKAACLHFSSEEEKNAAANNCVPNNRHIVLPNPLDLENFKDLGLLKGVFRKQYPETSGKKIILFLSRIDPIKGLDALIPALKILSLKRNDFIFVLAGSGNKNYEKRIRHALAKSGLAELSILPGFLEGRMKYAALADADIFALTSYHENFGMAAAEAMAAGLPVVISNRVQIQDLIRDYRAGLVTGLKPEEIASALQGLLEDESLRFKMGASGKRLAQERFDSPKIAKQAIEIYSRLIRKARSGKMN